MDFDDLWILRRLIKTNDLITAQTTRVIKQVGEHIRPNKGERINGDPNTIINLKEGYAANLGEVNFTDSLHLHEIFSKFQFHFICLRSRILMI